MKRHSAGRFALLAALSIGACGGESSPTAPPISAPSPSPAPAPSPTPTPTPAPTQSSASSATNFGGVGFGGALEIRTACNIAGKGIEIGGKNSALVMSNGAIGFKAIDKGEDFFRSPDPYFTDADFSLFTSLSDWSFFLVEKASFAAPSVTFGLTDFERLCFFAGGLPPTIPSGAPVSYRGVADGFAESGESGRLAFSDVQATVNPGSGTGTVTLKLHRLTPVLDDFQRDKAISIGTVTGNLIINGEEITAASIEGLPDYSGTIKGQYVGISGMALTFELHDSSGKVIWGAAALDSTGGQ